MRTGRRPSHASGVGRRRLLSARTGAAALLAALTAALSAGACGSSTSGARPAREAIAKPRATASAPRPAPPTAPPVASSAEPPRAGLSRRNGVSGLTLVFSAPARGAAIVGARVVVVDADFKTLSGYSLEDGRWIWRTEIQEEAWGRQRLEPREGSILFWGGDQMHRVDPVTGARTSLVDAPANNDCFFSENGSACAYACSCAMTLAECETGKRIGGAFNKTYVEFFDQDGEGSAGCFGRWTALLAGTGSVTVVMVEDEKAKRVGRSSREHIVLGLEASTGRQLWRSSELVLDRSVTSGASPDGRTCWISDNGAELRVFECASGSILWKRSAEGRDALPDRSFVRYVPERLGLFRSFGGAATLHDIRTGAVRFRVALSKGIKAIPIGASIPPYDLTAGKDAPMTLLMLRPTDGSIQARVPVPEGASVHDDPGGGFYVHASGGDVIAYDRGGRERGRLSSPSPPSASFGADFIYLFDNERLVLFDRSDFRRVGEIEGDFAVQPGSSLRGGILLYRSGDRGKKPGEAMLLHAAKP